jgi:hypothetical protein
MGAKRSVNLKKKNKIIVSEKRAPQKFGQKENVRRLEKTA